MSVFSIRIDFECVVLLNSFVKFNSFVLDITECLYTYSRNLSTNVNLRYLTSSLCSLDFC